MHDLRYDTHIGYRVSARVTHRIRGNFRFRAEVVDVIEVAEVVEVVEVVLRPESK